MTDQITGFGTLPFGQNEAGLIEFITRQIVNGMATVTLVQVKAVHAETVDVVPMVAQLDGAGNAIPHGTIHDLPFFTMRAGAAAIRVVPVVGDIGMAAFCHNDTSSVRANKAPAQPPTRRRFDWADGLYFGGFLGAAATVRMEVSGGGVFITGNVDITGSASVGTGATGTFSTPTGQTVTVQDGIITGIS